MVDPLAPGHLTPIRPTTPSAPAGPAQGGEQTSFAAQLREQLEHVSNMQAEAEQGIQHLLTGQTDNITEVFTTARKAEIAFSLLMEIRNKLVDAYAELRQLRV